MAGKAAGVSGDPGIGVLNAAGNVLVEAVLFWRLEVVDVLIALELWPSHNYLGTELAVAILLEVLGRQARLKKLGVGTNVRLGVVEGRGSEAPAGVSRDLTQSPEDSPKVADDVNLVHHHPVKGLLTEPPDVFLQNGMVCGHNSGRASRSEMCLVLDVLDTVEGEIGLETEFGEPAADSGLGGEDEGAG